MYMNLSDVINLQPLHPAWNDSKVDNLVQSFSKNGWNGRPLFFADDYLLSGSHRSRALELVSQSCDDVQWGDKLVDVMCIDDIQIPVVDLSEYLSEDQVDSALDFSDEEDRIAFLSELLPADIFNIFSLEQ